MTGPVRCYALSDEGFTVATARNGLEGVRTFEAHGADLVILDVLMLELGVAVSRHKELALARYRRVMAWPW